LAEKLFLVRICGKTLDTDPLTDNLGIAYSWRFSSLTATTFGLFFYCFSGFRRSFRFNYAKLMLISLVQ